MRVDFYQLSRDPVDRMVTQIARKVLDMGNRLLVVAGERARLEAIEKALWSDGPGQFLANGYADAPYASQQPVLLSDQCEAANGARIAILADGTWREGAEELDRVLLAFEAQQTEAARELWRGFSQNENIERHIFKQGQNGRWREGK